MITFKMFIFVCIWSAGAILLALGIALSILWLCANITGKGTRPKNARPAPPKGTNPVPVSDEPDYGKIFSGGKQKLLLKKEDTKL